MKEIRPRKWTPHQVFKECEAVGETHIRDVLARRVLPEGFAVHARVWIAELERKRGESSQAESLEIARSAKDASWAAVRAAHNANILAGVALGFAVIAIAISILGIFLG